METKRVITVDEKIKIVKLKVKVGTMIYDGRILLIYEPVLDNNFGDGEKQTQKKLLKSTEAGIIRKILIKEGDIVSSGSKIVELEKECNHPTVIRDLCAECGADLQKEDKKEGITASQASVSMVHMVPELKVNDELAQILGKADMDRLLQHKKLVLLVDLDQTLIHTTNDDIPNNIKDVYHFQLYGPRSPWYHTRLRPGTHHFLQGISEKYELHICTFGSRRYAHTIARFLDADGKIFSHRILSRDECFDANSKTANLKALFPCGENMVCIIDDREDVWEYASNLIHVKPYHFFQHTGDIHAPPGLTKCENDDCKEGFDFTQLADSISDNSTKNTDNGQEKLSTDDKEDVEDKNEEIADVESSQNTEKKIEIKSELLESLEKASPCDENEVNEKLDTVESEAVKEDSEQADLSVSIKEETPVDSTVADSESPTSTCESVSPQTDTGENVVAPQDACENATLHSPILSMPDKDGLIVIEESDDYLLYLEEILKFIHDEFFSRYEKTGVIPNLKQVIPERRSTILRDVNIVFSGIVPNRIKLEESPAYKIARSLGATVTQNIEPDTTHLVALRAGTAKVHSATKRKNLHLVTPEWLWTCAERWEKVDERLFPLKNAKPTAESRHPPAHCRSPDRVEPHLPPFVPETNKTTATPSSSSGFLFSINPWISLSSEDIESMEGEVEDIFKESDDETETDKEMQELDCAQDENQLIFGKKRKLDEDTSSSSSSFPGDEDDSECRTKTKRKKKLEADAYSSNERDEDDEEDSDDDETINDKFRRGEGLPSDLDIDYNSEEGTEEEHESDGEWNVMGAALEREFLED